MKEAASNQTKQNVAVFFGGCSPEYSVSLQSAAAVLDNLNREKYRPVPVGITENGEWFYYDGSTGAIRDDSWHRSASCIPAALSPSRRKHALLLLHENGCEELPIDIAFPVLHGRNGEDGSLQGAVALAGIPLAGCGVLASALCMDKARAHRLAAEIGVRTPRAFVLAQGAPREAALDFARETGYPLFVKPVKAGSSFGITRVARESELLPAVCCAFAYDDEVIIEENIEGFEVGCAVLGNGPSPADLTVGEVDEIELTSGFFDFTEKYTLKTSYIHVPARISPEKAAEIKETAKKIYLATGCRVFARVDLFLTPQGDVVFNEINTIPGFTEHSRYPGMMRAAGFSFASVLERILKLAVIA